MNNLRQDDAATVDYYGFYHLLNQYVLKMQRDQTISVLVKQNSLVEVGFRIGRGVIEKITENCLEKFKEAPNSAKCTAQIKFICKEFWNFVFLKNVDQVNTNTKGVFFISVFNFTMFQKLFSNDSVEVQEYKNLWYFLIKGLIEGAMKGLSYPSDTTVETLQKEGEQGCFKISIKILNYQTTSSMQQNK